MWVLRGVPGKETGDPLKEPGVPLKEMRSRLSSASSDRMCSLEIDSLSPPSPGVFGRRHFHLRCPERESARERERESERERERERERESERERERERAREREDGGERERDGNVREKGIYW